MSEQKLQRLESREEDHSSIRLSKPVEFRKIIITPAYHVSLASAELGVVGLAADVEIIVIRVVAALATVSVATTEEAHETIANVTAGQALELLKIRLLSDIGGVQHLALLGCLLVPSTLEVLQVNHTLRKKKELAGQLMRDQENESSRLKMLSNLPPLDLFSHSHIFCLMSSLLVGKGNSWTE